MRRYLDVAVAVAILGVLVITLDPSVARHDAVVATDQSSLSFGVLPTAAHALIFAALGLVVGLRLALVPGAASWWRTIAAFVVIAAFAAADEQAQRLVDGHGPEFIDWVADVLGAGVGLTLAVMLTRFERSRVWLRR